VSTKRPHPFQLHIKPSGDCRHHWEIHDAAGLIHAGPSFLTAEEAEAAGRLQMQGTIAMWNKR
jgi:hypothetical protein